MDKYLLLFLAFFVAACATSEPIPTHTPLPPTHTSMPPTHTSSPPTDTPIPPTSTSVPTSTATRKPFHIETDSFEFEGQERTHMLFIPDSYSDSQNYPLVIDLHALDLTAEHEMNYTQLNQVAESYGFMVVYPSAIENWNSGVGDHVDFETPDVDDVGYINALIDTLSKGYSIDLERIYATGFSNGGFMAYKLACQLSHRIAAIASVSGVLSTRTLANCNPLRPVPVLQIHGTADLEVLIFGGLGDPTGWESVHRTLNYWIALNNCVETNTTNIEDSDQTDGSVVEKTSYTNCDNNSNVIYFKVIPGGHTWPGAGWSGYSLGNTNQDINASVEIWDFFMDHQLTPTSTQSNE